MQSRLPAQPLRGMAAAAPPAPALARMAASVRPFLTTLLVAALLLAGWSDPCRAFDLRSPTALMSPSLRRSSRAAVVGARFQGLTTPPVVAAGGRSSAPTTTSTTTTQLFAAKKASKKQRESKGFGKPAESTATAPSTEENSARSTARGPSAASPASASPTTTTASYTPLQSVSGDWASKPAAASPIRDEEDLLTPEERAARILRDKYGMKTLGEQQSDAMQQTAMKEQRKKFAEWKKKLDSEEGEAEFDVMSMLPAPVLRGIDVFLKAGVTVAGGAFVMSGIGITLEAWSKTTGNAIDPNLDRFIVETVEPNFTAGLLVLLSFSVSLGLFAAAQLGSAGAVYKENE